LNAAAGTRQPLVLMGFAEAEAAPEVAWSLVDAGMRVVAFARRGHNAPLRHSRYVTCHEISAPEDNLERTRAELRKLMHAIRTDNSSLPTVLFPLDDTAVWLCDQVASRSSWVLAGPTGERAALALDKSRQIALARDCGMSVPDTVEARTVAEVQVFAARVGFPLMLKSSQCVSVNDGRRLPRHSWMVATERELQRAMSRWDTRSPLLAQAFIIGCGEGIFGVRGPDGVRGWSGHRRLRMMNPHGSGSSACVAQDVAAEVRGQVEAFLAKACWRGLFMIEMLRDAMGTLWFMELNGRPWGSMALARRQGLEYPAWHVSLAQNDHSDAGRTATMTPGLVCRNVGRELMHLAFVLRGPKSSAPIRWPPFWRSFKDIMTIGRGDGIYNWRSSDWRVFVADVYATISKNAVKQAV
jgi:predicted ATP-grasp superfamily ATP-dependent carboligase